MVGCVTFLFCFSFGGWKGLELRGEEDMEGLRREADMDLFENSQAREGWYGKDDSSNKVDGFLEMS